MPNPSAGLGPSPCLASGAGIGPSAGLNGGRARSVPACVDLAYGGAFDIVATDPDRKLRRAITLDTMLCRHGIGIASFTIRPGVAVTRSQAPGQPSAARRSQLHHRDVIARQVSQEEPAVRLGGRTDARHNAPVQVVQRLHGPPVCVEPHDGAPRLGDQGKQREDHAQPEAAVAAARDAVGHAGQPVDEHLRLAAPRAAQPVAQDAGVVGLDHRHPRLVLAQRHAIGVVEAAQQLSGAARLGVEPQQPACCRAAHRAQRGGAHRVVKAAVRVEGHGVVGAAREVDGTILGQVISKQ
eukprot:scaffold7458_cov61-Phaeocystis_antarctica.AAC.2